MQRFKRGRPAHLRHPAAARPPAGRRRLRGWRRRSIVAGCSTPPVGLRRTDSCRPAPFLAREVSARWLKPLVSVSLYAFIFCFTDVRAILARLADARFEYVAAGVLIYAAGQALSTWKWRLLLAPVGLGAVRTTRLLAFYFIGMFFNLFLPTVIGGDAVKAVLLARETGSAGPRDDLRIHGAQPRVSRAAVDRPHRGLARAACDLMGVTLSTLTVLLFSGFIAQ